MKTCPICGFQGDLEHCPNDGEPLLSQQELAARSPQDPTQAPSADARRREHAEAPLPQVGTDPTFAALPEDSQSIADQHAELRDENFGQWAEPEVQKKDTGDPMLGRTIAGRYEVVRLLGQGGMGAVYLARQPVVQRDIALKILLKEFAENETVIKRFHQEALAASRLTHHNTIKVYDFGQTEDGILYMAMEFLKGVSLQQDLAKAGAVPPKRVIHIMRQVCKSLAEAHKEGIIHRDLKPDNIFLQEVEGERDFAKVLDFGVAKLKEYEGKEGTLTQAGMIFGTPKYMSPEQARSGDLDARSDIYALGVIMYEMLMGKAPFSSDNPLSILISHVNEAPRRFAAFNPRVQVPDALEAVVFRMLAKDREERQPDVEQVIAELDAVDELLSGASYDEVAGRLPDLLPGADGTPSVVGAAVVPRGAEGTAPNQAVDGRGNTVMLDASGKPAESSSPSLMTGELDLSREHAPADDRRSGGALPIMIALGILIPLVGAGAWLFGGGEDEPGPGQPAVAAKAPEPKPVVAPPKDAAVAAKPAADAAIVAAKGPEKPKPVKPKPRMETVVIGTRPSGVAVHDAATGRLVGVADPNLQVKLASNKQYTLKKTGYYSKTVTVKKDETVQNFRLKPEPRAVSRKPAPATTTVKPPPERKPIELDSSRRGRRSLDLQ
jgi:serine/threonine-protein kinase